MPVEVLSDRLEMLLKYIWRYNDEDKGPFEYVCRARDWRASQSNEYIEDEDGRVLRARRRWKARQGQRTRRVTSTESRQYLDREDFLFLLLGTEGVTES